MKYNGVAVAFLAPEATALRGSFGDHWSAGARVIPVVVFLAGQFLNLALLLLY